MGSETKTKPACSKLNIRTDKATHGCFHGACLILGTTMERELNEHMRHVIAKAGIQVQPLTNPNPTD